MVWVKGLHIGLAPGEDGEEERGRKREIRKKERVASSGAETKLPSQNIAPIVAEGRFLRDDGRRSTNGNRDESFADPRITSARQRPIIRLALSYETIRAFDFCYAPQDRDLITPKDCDVRCNVSY